MSEKKVFAILELIAMLYLFVYDFKMAGAIITLVFCSNMTSKDVDHPEDLK